MKTDARGFHKLPCGHEARCKECKTWDAAMVNVTHAVADRLGFSIYRCMKCGRTHAAKNQEATA